MKKGQKNDKKKHDWFGSGSTAAKNSLNKNQQKNIKVINKPIITRRNGG